MRVLTVFKYVTKWALAGLLVVYALVCILGIIFFSLLWMAGV